MGQSPGGQGQPGYTADSQSSTNGKAGANTGTGGNVAPNSQVGPGRVVSGTGAPVTAGTGNQRAQRTSATDLERVTRNLRKRLIGPMSVTGGTLWKN